MKTEDLVALLASEARPIKHQTNTLRRTAALASGAFVALISMLALKGLRADIADAIHIPMFWLKIAFPACLLMTSVLAITRLGYPGTRLGYLGVGLASPVAAIWLVSAASLYESPSSGREALIFGTTWIECVINIVIFSVPALIGALGQPRNWHPHAYVWPALLLACLRALQHHWSTRFIVQRWRLHLWERGMF